MGWRTSKAGLDMSADKFYVLRMKAGYIIMIYGKRINFYDLYLL